MAKARLCFSKGAGATAVAHPNNSRKMFFYKFNYIFIILKEIIWKHVFYRYVFQEASLHRLTVVCEGVFRSLGTVALQQLLRKLCVVFLRIIFILHLKMRFQHPLFHSSQWDGD